MLDIKTLASGSTGNAYRIRDGTTTILLECGIPIRKLRKALDYDLASIRACVITHEHADHSRAVDDLMRLGIPVYCSPGTAQALGIVQNPFCIPVFEYMQTLQTVPIGSMRIRPLAVPHDAEQPMGFLIESEQDGERIAFFTDCGKVPYILPPCEHWMIECNHMGEAVMGSQNAIHAYRVLHNHLSLEDCIDALKHQDLSRTQDIRLLHISATNGDPAAMKEAVAAATGKHIIIAQEEIP